MCYRLLVDAADMSVQVKSYKQLDLALASSDYMQMEQDIKEDRNKDAVLVSVESLASLRGAYPNYFLDTHRFLASVQRAIA